MASTQLQRTSGTSTENYKYTFSAWVKRTGVLGSSSVNEVLFSAWDGSNNSAYIRFEDQNDNLQVYDKYGSVVDLNYQTDMKFRDPNAFYHIVVDVDGTRSANQRCKIYVNGSQVSCSNTTDTGGTLAMKTVTATNATRLGAIRTSGGAEYYFSGIMSHVHYIDGTGYDASYFGETDSTTGEWKIKTNVTGVTYGNNGFFILKDGNSVTDQSGNGNNLTVATGTLTKTEDNPSNVFATWNPLVKPWAGNTTWTYGNTRGYNSDSNKGSLVTTLGATSGKYYMEVKQENSNSVWIGVAGEGFVSDNVYNKYSGQTQNANTGLLLKLSDGTRAVNSTQTNSVFTSTGQGDITGIALDLDASTRTVTFYKNGVADSAGAQNLPTNMQTGAVFGCAIVYGGSAVNLNAGNGYFANNAVSSAGTNASGIGIFEYDVPANHTALSTKGLNE